MNSLLITGICGFVGSTLAKAFRERHPEWEITGIDNLCRPGSWLNKPELERDHDIRVIHGDIRNASDLEGMQAVDWVIDCAANASVLAGVDGKTSTRQLVEHNLMGTINLLEYCKTHGAGFALISTSRVYSIPPMAGIAVTAIDDAFRPDPEQTFPAGLTPNGVSEQFSTSAPVSLYGATKLASEQLVLEYSYSYQFPAWINRCGVMAGAGQFGQPAQGIMAYWIHSFREGKPLKYIGFGGNGYQVRDCLHPADLASLLDKQFAEPLSSEKPRILNASGGISNAFSLARLTELCRQRFPESKTQVTGTDEERAFDMPWIVLDNAAAHWFWNWHPEHTFEGIFDEIAAFSETHPDWLAVSR